MENSLFLLVLKNILSPFINLINYASLVTTNAARHRHVAGKSKILLEFGLRRAQGPDGAISASKYCFMGGFDATSNVLAGNLFGIPLCGTHSHAYVSSYMVMRSGIPNFCAVVLALHDLGYKASGVRLDSGDLAYLSIAARKVFRAIEEEFNIPDFGKMIITASNDLNEETIDALNKQGHEVDAFGIGTYLVTCYSRAALGCVFKLVEINSRPRIKLSEDVAKVSIPCKKAMFQIVWKRRLPVGRHHDT